MGVVVVETLFCEFVDDVLLPFVLFDAFCWDWKYTKSTKKLLYVHKTSLKMC